MRDPLPAGLAFSSADGLGWSCTADGRLVTCTHVGDLVAGATTTFSITVHVGEGAVPSVLNAVSVRSSTSDPTPDDNVSSDPTVVHLPATPPPPPSPPAVSGGDTAPSDPATSASLAYTGYDFERVAVLGLVLLFLGLAGIMVWFVRRRRPRHRAALLSGHRPRHGRSGGRWALRSGTGLVVAALVVAGHLGWMLWGTGLETARAQTALRGAFATSDPTVHRHGQPRMPSRFALGDPVGILRIPRIHLDMVIVEGTGESELAKGPGHYAGTAYPWDRTGRVGIAGHRTTYLHPFYSLNELVAGDRIQIQTKAGTFRYVVVRHALASPSDVSVLRQTRRPTLVLTTCAPPYSAAERLVVFAVQL